jgi:hypothetical protein
LDCSPGRRPSSATARRGAYTLDLSDGLVTVIRTGSRWSCLFQFLYSLLDLVFAWHGFESVPSTWQSFAKVLPERERGTTRVLSTWRSCRSTASTCPWGFPLAAAYKMTSFPSSFPQQTHPFRFQKLKVRFPPSELIQFVFCLSQVRERKDGLQPEPGELHRRRDQGPHRGNNLSLVTSQCCMRGSSRRWLKSLSFCRRRQGR